MNDILETGAKVGIIAIAVFLFLRWRKGQRGCGCQKQASMAMGPEVAGAGGPTCGWGGKRTWA